MSMQQERRKMQRRATDGNGWQKYQELVLTKLESLDRKQEQTNKKIDEVKHDMHITPCPTARLIEQQVENETVRTDAAITGMEQSFQRALNNFKWFVGALIGGGSVILAVIKVWTEWGGN